MKNAIILTDFTDAVSLTRILGPYKVAHELRKHGIDTTVINFLHMWTYDEIVALLSQLINDDTVFVGVSNFFYKDTQGVDVYDDSQPLRFNPADPNLLIPHGPEASEQLRLWLKQRGQTLVLGGPTAFDIEQNSKFDYLIQGFSEKSIINFVAHRTQGTTLKNSYRSIYGPTVIRDINAEENFDFATSDFRWHDDDCLLPREVLNIELARGCIFKCNFCSFPLIGKKKFDYIKHQELVKQELIENYERFGTTVYYFGDETFNDSVDKVDMIYNISKELPFQLEYFAYLRLDLIERNPETVEKLFASGCRYTHFGIETLHPQAGRAINKSFTFDRAKRTLERFRAVGGSDINLHATMMVGLPYETESSARETYNLIIANELPIDSFYYFATTINRQPFPQSYFSQNYAEFGYEVIDPADPQYCDRMANLPTSLNQWPGPGIFWRNSTNGMDFFSAHDLAVEFNHGGTQHKKLGSVAAFGIAGLDLPNTMWKNQTYQTADWFAVTQQKRRRFAEYRRLINSVVDRKSTS